MSLIFVDCQGATLLDGAGINLDLEYNDETDMFELEADCYNWAEDLRDLHAEYYQDSDDDVELTISDAEAECDDITGSYFTLREINDVLRECCEHGSWYEFHWEYDDGTPVE